MKTEAETLKEFFKTIESAFVLGEFEILADHYSMPTVVYSPAGVAIINDKKQFAELFSNYKDLLDSKQITQSHHQILDEEPTINQRKKVSVKFTKFHSMDETPVINDVKFFLIFEDCGAPKIEMLEFLTLPTTVDDLETLLPRNQDTSKNSSLAPAYRTAT